MSKESIIKKRLQKIDEQNRASKQQPEQSVKSETYVPVYRRPAKRRLNRRFLVTLAIWLCALFAALYFLSRT